MRQNVVFWDDQWNWYISGQTNQKRERERKKIMKYQYQESEIEHNFRFTDIKRLVRQYYCKVYDHRCDKLDEIGNFHKSQLPKLTQMYSLVLALFSLIAEGHPSQGDEAEYLCFSLLPSLKWNAAFFVYLYQKKRKERIPRKKFLLKYSQVRYLTFGNYSGHSSAACSLFWPAGYI